MELSVTGSDIPVVCGALSTNESSLRIVVALVKILSCVVHLVLLRCLGG